MEEDSTHLNASNEANEDDSSYSSTHGVTMDFPITEEDPNQEPCKDEDNQDSCSQESGKFPYPSPQLTLY